MTIKELAHSAHQHLQAISGTPFKRTHVYELLGAAFGYGSYAAFSFEAALTAPKAPPWDYKINTPAIYQRCIDLGYTLAVANQVSIDLSAYLASRNICSIRIQNLVNRLRDESDYEDEEAAPDDATDSFGSRWYEPEYLMSPLLLESLEMAANKGVAEAHYGLALIYGPDEYDDDESVGSSYWHDQEQQGRVLTGVEKEWADAYVDGLAREEKYETHLREAARLGSQFALLEMADQFGDPRFFEQTTSEIDVDPSAIAEIAKNMGREDDARRWLTKAAESGDIDAMRELIEEHDANDLQRCWIWIYLAELHGTDLTKDDHYAIHEDGSRYDWDVGGNAFVAGEDGIDLPPLPDIDDKAVKMAAEALFKRCPS